MALSVNDVIGSGVYLALPAAAAALLGPASVWAVLAAGFAVLLLVLCFAEAGSLFDRPGSGYVYTRAAYGDFVGFEVGWMTWIARIASLAALSVGFSLALGFLWKGAANGIGQKLVVAAVILALTWINLIGIKSGARTAVVLAFGKVLPLLLLVAVGLLAMSLGSISAPEPPQRQAGGLKEAALLLLFAYAGFENTAAPAGEFKNPKRDVPFALLVQVTLVTAIYSSVQLVAVGTVPDLPSSKTPLADAARLLMGPAGGLILTVGAVLSILGTNNNTVLAGARYLYALAESGGLPSPLARVHPRFRTPHLAILTQSAIALPLALSGTFTQLAALSVVARLATYIGTAAAVPVLRRKFPATYRTIRLPGGPAIPIAALLICLVFLSSATARNLIAGAMALTVGAVIYLARRRSSSPEAPV